MEFFGADRVNQRRPVVLMVFDDGAQIDVQRVAGQIPGEPRGRQAATIAVSANRGRRRLTGRQAEIVDEPLNLL